MSFFNPLWKSSIDKNIGKTQFEKDCDLQNQNYPDMNKNKYVSMSTLDRICDNLQCNMADVIKFIPDENSLQD